MPGLTVRLRASQTAKLLVLDAYGDPIAGAEVLIAGLGRCKSNGQGCARFYLPGPETAVVVTANGREEVLYEKALAPGRTYVYRPDPEVSAGRYFVLAEE